MCISSSAATIFFLLLFIHETTAQNNCSIEFCSRGFIPVRFPFHLQGDSQSPSCGFPGFDLSCSALGATVLRIPNSGKFIVRTIDYLNQQILLYDPGNCIPERLLELNLTGTPFTGSNYGSYTIVDCPSNISSLGAISSSNIVRCLSNSTNTVVATTSKSLAESLSNSSCKRRGTYRVPISRTSYYKQGTASDLSRDLELSWYAPNCRDCEIKGGVCGFRNFTAQEIGCFYDSTPTERMGLHIFRLICFTIAVPATICAISVVCFLGCANRGDDNQRSETTQHNNIAIVPEPHVLPIGLDDSTIQSFEKVVVGESRRLSGPNHSACSICLSEYLPKDILRCIPECKHCFHADCIDEWLRINNTCPICRNSPMPSPAHHIHSQLTLNNQDVV